MTPEGLTHGLAAWDGCSRFLAIPVTFEPRAVVVIELSS
jgi:hypothetical protein